MSLASIAARSLFAYAYLWALTRLSGKRAMLHNTPMDFLAALILGDMIDNLLWGQTPASVFVAGTGSLILTHLLVTYASYRSETVRRWVEGGPCEIVHDGGIETGGCRRERVSEEDAKELLRAMGERDMREAKALILETSGNPSLLKRRWARTAQNDDVERLKGRLKEPLK